MSATLVNFVAGITRAFRSAENPANVGQPINVPPASTSDGRVWMLVSKESMVQIYSRLATALWGPSVEEPTIKAPVSETLPTAQPMSEQLHAAIMPLHKKAMENAFLKSLMSGGINTENFKQHLDNSHFFYLACDSCLALFQENDPIYKLIQAEARAPKIERDAQYWGATLQSESVHPAAKALYEFVSKCQSEGDKASFLGVVYATHASVLAHSERVQQNVATACPATGKGAALFHTENAEASIASIRAAVDKFPQTQEDRERMIEGARTTFKAILEMTGTPVQVIA